MGKIPEKNFSNRTKEEMREIGKMGAKKRTENYHKQKNLERCMRAILRMKVVGSKQRDILRQMGFAEDELVNETLLTTALFRKAISGDVQAFKEIRSMVGELEMFEQTGKTQQQNIIINLVSQGETYQPTEEEQKDIWNIENGIDTEESIEDDWGDDVYVGK